MVADIIVLQPAAKARAAEGWRAIGPAGSANSDRRSVASPPSAAMTFGEVGPMRGIDPDRVAPFLAPASLRLEPACNLVDARLLVVEDNKGTGLRRRPDRL
jgi:hypothetical protein